MKAKAIELLKEAILKGELHYYRQTGSTAYVVEYEDGELQIVYNSLSAKEARPGVEFEIIASAKWEDRLGNPQWTIYDDCEAVAAIATEIDGTVTEPDVYYYSV
jgi:hypothetical protein